MPQQASCSFRRRSIFMILGAACLLAACHKAPPASEKTTMTTLGPRLQPLFETTKTVCFGRFVMEVPATATVVWGPPLDPKIWIDKGAAGQLDQEVAKREDALKNEPRFPRTKGLSLYEETVPGVLPGQKIVVSQESFGASTSEGVSKRLRFESFHRIGEHLARMHAVSLRDAGAGPGMSVEATLATLNADAKRLRFREESEAPAELGVCLENGFLAEDASALAAEYSGHTQIGVRLKEFPDVHFSIHVGPANSSDPESNSLVRSHERQKESIAREHPEYWAQIEWLRKGERKIREWHTGYEILARLPAEGETRSHHDFQAKFTGVPKSALRPYADIRLQTGVADNVPGQLRPSLDDSEAMALWNVLTESIRVRHGTAPAAVSQAAPERLPLGQLVATGGVCPQSGLWQCAEVQEVEGGRRRHFSLGEALPEVAVLGEPSVWQKITGERPRYKVATVWQLISYDDAGSAAAFSAGAPVKGGDHGDRGPA